MLFICNLHRQFTVQCLFVFVFETNSWESKNVPNTYTIVIYKYCTNVILYYSHVYRIKDMKIVAYVINIFV